MRAPVRGHELGLLGRQKVAYLEDALDMRRRNRHAVSGVRDLRDEAAVLAERLGQPQSGSGRAILQHLLQNALVLGDDGRIRHRA